MHDRGVVHAAACICCKGCVTCTYPGKPVRDTCVLGDMSMEQTGRRTCKHQWFLPHPWLLSSEHAVHVTIVSPPPFVRKCMLERQTLPMSSPLSLLCYMQATWPDNSSMDLIHTAYITIEVSWVSSCYENTFTYLRYACLLLNAGPHSMATDPVLCTKTCVTYIATVAAGSKS